MKGLLLLERLGPRLRLSAALFLALALLISLAATTAVADERPADHQYKPRDNNDNDNNNNHHNNHHNNNNNNHHNNNNKNNGGGDAFEVAQENEQSADSGDLNQQSTITGGGDNSTQCANPQITGNTGNSQNQTNISQYVSDDSEFEFDDSGSFITENPNEHVQTVFSCTADVNQAAAASWTNASDVATGLLNTAGGLTSLGVLGTLGLAGTGLMIRRSRSS
jgi:hypothetical protein